MPLSLEIRIRRMNKRIVELEQWLARETLPLTDWTLDGQPIAKGTRWQDRGTPRRFAHPEVTLPAHWPLHEPASPCGWAARACCVWAIRPMG